MINMLIRMAAAVILGAAAYLVHSGTIEFFLFLAAYLIIGGDIIIRAVKNITRGQVFDEHFLMALATIGAFLIQQYPEGVAVMLFYQIGELFQGAAVSRSRKSISALMDIRPDYANVKTENGIELVSPEDVQIGDIIVVNPGESIPLDSKVVQGLAMVDTSALTGESVPRKAAEGQDVMSGFINQNGVLHIEVTKGYRESAVSKILDLVQNASSRKARTENFITKFAKYYTCCCDHRGIAGLCPAAGSSRRRTFGLGVPCTYFLSDFLSMCACCLYSARFLRRNRSSLKGRSACEGKQLFRSLESSQIRGV